MSFCLNRPAVKILILTVVLFSDSMLIFLLSLNVLSFKDERKLGLQQVKHSKGEKAKVLGTGLRMGVKREVEKKLERIYSYFILPL